jgi:cytoskeletal protein CcmA (bactofilin family)
MRSVTRTILVLLTAVLALTMQGAAAGAQDDDGLDDDEIDNIVVVTGRAEVRQGETVDNVFILDGPVVVDGTVQEVLVAVNSDILVRGTVEEDVVAVDGRVTIADGGVVEGDITSRHRPTVEGNGRFEGSWERLRPQSWRGAASVVGWLAGWLAVTVSTLVLGLLLWLLAPRAAHAVEEAFGGGVGRVVLWGVVLLIGLPLLAIVAMVTLVGLPFGIGLLLALGLIFHIGYVAGALVLGRRIMRSASPVVAFLVGWGILRVLALVPILGGLVWLVATVVGLGAIAVAIGRARRGRALAREHDEPLSPTPSSAPPPPAPSPGGP